MNYAGILLAEHGIKQQFLPCSIIMAKFYANVALLLPKGSFYAEMFCIKFPCVSCVQYSPYHK